VIARFQSSSALIALSVLLAALALGVSLATAPYLRLATLDREITASQSALVALRKELTSEDTQRKENAALAVSDKQARFLLIAGDTTGIAGANLQKLVSELVVAHGGEASSLQILPPKEDGDLTRIPMSLSIRVGIDGLRDIIHGLETNTPLIFIDNIAIRADHDDIRGQDRYYLGPLDVTLQVSGYAIKKEAS
jgi:general secretion pathway protein M